MIYINGLANISPQPTFNNKEFLTDIRQYKTNMLQCIEPDYSHFFHPNALRRIGRVLRLGWAGAKSCLDDAGLQTPDTICVGTGKGCFKNTHIFLDSVIVNDEKFVPPSPFIQSAHGSIASQIAIQTGCKNYNMTYSHRAFSFESALLDAVMILKEDKYKNVLVGGVDEIEEIQFRTFDRIGHFKNPETNNLSLLTKKSKGTIAGEGSAFFFLENHPTEKTYARIRSVHTFSNPKGQIEIEKQIETFLSNNSLSVNELDLFIPGLNGDLDFDWIYNDLMKSIFLETNQVYYKHLCGEYHTSSAFAMWLSSMIIHRQVIPEIIDFNKKPLREVRNILIYNQYRNVNHSLILVSRHN